ncbi:MAG: AAA family ATPase [Cyanobacteria bacterium SZAS LIN-2]|nr:AAA family ATPase [Cyanobacteria bacterium SZAS LIN-2]
MNNFFKRLFGGWNLNFKSFWLWGTIIIVAYGAAQYFIIHPEQPKQQKVERLFQDGSLSDVWNAMAADPKHSHIRFAAADENGQYYVFCECGDKSIKSVQPIFLAKTVGDKALELGVAVEAIDDGQGGHIRPEGIPWFTLISTAASVAFLVIFVMMARRGGVGGAAALMKGEEFKPITNIQTRFADIAGIPETKGELQTIVTFFRDRKTLEEVGGEIPRAIMLVGPSGTGKTELARAMAGEAGVPFYSIKATRLVEMFVGVGAKRFREQWLEASKNSPCVVFMDEVDAIARKRGMDAGNSERDVTLNEILTCLDGIEGRYPILLICATNLAEMIDPAFKSRMTRIIQVPLPTTSGRKAIFRIHARNVPIVGKDDEATFDKILDLAAKLSEGMSGRDIMKVMREQIHVRCYAKYGELRNPLPTELIYEAIEAGLLGDPLLSRMRLPAVRHRVSHHEGAHLIVEEELFRYSLAEQRKGRLAEDSFWGNETKLATIIPRSTGSEGVMLAMPLDGDTANLLTWEAICGKLMVSQAGNTGEFFGTGTCTNGNSGDNQMAGRLAKLAVLKAAMCVFGPRSLKIPPIFIGDDGRQGNSLTPPAEPYMESQRSLEQIDESIGEFLLAGRYGADAIVRQRLELLDEIAAVLKKEGTIRRDEYVSLFDKWAVKKPLDHEQWLKYFRPNGEEVTEIKKRSNFLLLGGDARLDTPALVATEGQR